MTDPGEIEAIAVGAVLACAILFGAMFVLRRLRLKRAATGAPARPEVASDRAYNRIAMARRELSVLRLQGVDVARPLDLIALADRSYQSREFDRAFELAQSAHESLVRLRRAPPSEPVATGPAPDPPVPRAAAAPTPTVGPPPPALVPKIPKNKLESQFQLHLFETEAAGKPETPNLAAARGFYTEAQAAAAREEYTEALRLALKARRQLGGAIESLGRPTPAAAAAALPSRASEPAGTADRVAGADRCSRCGHPIVAGDAFCRGCGAPRSGAPTVCPRCGADRTTADAFCGKCGTRYD